MFQVAIDGPGGAGKSTISKAVAEKLGFVYIDTGAMYRAQALYCLRQGIDILNEPEKVVAALDQMHVALKISDEGQRTMLNNEDVTDKIRTAEVSMGASAISAIKEVRARLVAQQQELAMSENIIMDGRDIGTCVLPAARVKVFLTASENVRAKRRFDELMLKGENCTFEEVLEDIRVRDKNDSTRAVSPLRRATDSILIDTSNMTFEEACRAVEELIYSVMQSEPFELTEHH